MAYTKIPCAGAGNFCRLSRECREFYGDLRLLVFVAEAVRYNLSQGKFPDNREFNREFFDFRPFSVILARNRCAKSMACSKIPYETEQGIFFAEQGIFWSEQGISGKGRAQDRGGSGALEEPMLPGGLQTIKPRAGGLAENHSVYNELLPFRPSRALLHFGPRSRRRGHRISRYDRHNQSSWGCSCSRKNRCFHGLHGVLVAR